VVATGGDKPRQAATEEPDVSPHVARLEREVEQLNDDRDFLREQIKVKDSQIGALLERDRETNILVRRVAGNPHAAAWPGSAKT